MNRLTYTVVALLVICCNICNAVDGQWSSWSTCSLSCGGGLQTRMCNHPAPSQGGLPCGGYNFQYCGTDPCDTGGIIMTITFNYLKANLTGQNVYLLSAQFSDELISAIHLDDHSQVDVLNIYMPGNSQTVIVFELNTHNGDVSNQNNADALNKLINTPGSIIYNSYNFPLLSTTVPPSTPEEKWYNNLTQNPVFWVVLWGAVVLILVLVYCKFCYCRKRQSAKEEKKDQEELQQNYIRLQEAEDRNAPLPNGWMRKYDRDKKEKYYYNTVTHSTTFERPTS